MNPFRSLTARWLCAAAAVLVPTTGSAQVWHFPGGTYYWSSQDDHRAVFDSLVESGYRLTSLDIWGPWDLGTVNAIWRLEGGAPWVAYQYLTPSDYQAMYNHWVDGLGYRPYRVTASGDVKLVGYEVRYGCIFVRDGVRAYARHGMTRTELSAENIAARRAGLMLDCIAVHGNPWTYAAIWVENTNNVDWTLLNGLDAQTYQTTFVNHANLGYGPAFVTVNKDGDDRYFAILRSPVSYAWTAYHNIPLSGHAALVNTLVAKGWSPLHVARGGNTAAGVWTR